MTTRYKYPRTPHLPWSEGTTKDDKIIEDLNTLEQNEVVVTLKMDVENTTLYNDVLHARSIDSKDHESRHWLKAFHACVSQNIPDKFRVCGENVFAKHSIYYKDLQSYFLAFSIWRDEECLSWGLTKKLLNDWYIFPVKTIYEGFWPGQEKLTEVFAPYESEHEGYVVRIKGRFYLQNFSVSVAKFVRQNHVQTDKHWMHEEIKQNKLLK